MILQEKDILKLSGEDVQDIRVIRSGLPYKVIDPTKPNFGKTYSQCQVNGVVFTVNDDDEMLSWRKSNDLFSVNLKESEETVDITASDGSVTATKVKRLQLVGARSISGSIASRTAVCHYESITPQNFKPSVITKVEELEALG